MDWDSSTAGVQVSETAAVDLGTYSSGGVTVGSFTIDLGAGFDINDYTFEVHAPTADQFGTLTAVSSGNNNVYDIVFTPDTDNEILKSLEEDETSNKVMQLEIVVTNKSASDAEGFARSVEEVRVEFTGQNQSPNAPTSFVVDEAAIDTGVDGIWNFSDVDGDNNIADKGLQATTGIGQTPITIDLVVNPDAAEYDPEATAIVSGQYGDFTFKADGTWAYALDAARADAVKVSGAEEILRFRVVDKNNAISDIGEYKVEIRGENDAPVLTVTGTGDTDADNSQIKLTVTETTSSGTSHSDVTADQGKPSAGLIQRLTLIWRTVKAFVSSLVLLKSALYRPDQIRLSIKVFMAKSRSRQMALGIIN